MKRALILTVGRRKDPELRRLCEDYYRRCSRHMQVEQREVKDLAAMRRALPHRDALVLALDERGRQRSSPQLAQLLKSWLEGPASTLVFLVGGADGLDDELRRRADHLLSLSKLTIAHRLVHVLLAEQLYRAVSIIEGSPYHRG